jgi:hypothetical protein
MERSILAEREMRARNVAVGPVTCQQMAKVPFPLQHDIVGVELSAICREREIEKQHTKLGS